MLAVLHTSYFILHTCWTELTLRKERQLYVNSLAKGIYVCGPPALRLLLKGPGCGQSPTAHSNQLSHIHTFFFVCTYVHTRALKTQVRYCKYNLNSVTTCHQVLLHLLMPGSAAAAAAAVAAAAAATAHCCRRPLLPPLTAAAAHCCHRPLLPPLTAADAAASAGTLSYFQVRPTRCTSHFILHTSHLLDRTDTPESEAIVC